MKVLAASLVALLLVATCSPSEAHLGVGVTAREYDTRGDGVPSTCCFSYRQQPIPRSLIASVYITSSSCSQPGVVLVTKKKKELCADPQAAWVQAHLKHFQTMKN